MLDRATLIERNQAMTAAFHRLPFKHQLRRSLLRAAAALPIQQQPIADERIVLIRPDHLGDVLLTTPAVAMLRAALPTAELHALVNPASATLLSYYEAIDTVLTLPFPGFMRDQANDSLSPYRLALRSSRMLRRIGYQTAIILRPDHWWGALVAFLAGIPQRIGYALPDVQPFLTDPIALVDAHAIDQSLRLVGTLTHTQPPVDAMPDFPIGAVDDDAIGALLTDHGIVADDPLLVIHVGAGSAVKRWTPEGWARVADVLGDQLGARVILTGGDHERADAEAIAHLTARPTTLLVGETTIGTLAALFARSRLALGADSGPLHLAAAVGTPTVTLFGPADPHEFAPRGDPRHTLVVTTDIACRPCRILDWRGDSLDYHPCVREITVVRVLEAARRALSGL